MSVIYLDNNATTRIAPEVLEAMLPWLGERYANPSSVHHFGQQARHAVEVAREQVAAAMGVRDRQIIFTGSGTESNNLAIRGVLAARPEKRHVATTAVEHDSVLRPMQQLEREGYRVTYLGVDSLGHLDLGELEASLSDQTALVSIMHANNETGVIFPIERIAALTSAKDIPLHVDAVQTTGRIRDASGHSPLNLVDVPVDLLTASAHKFHGPKGVGILYLRRGARLRPQVLGGHQERDLRAGTENVAGIVGAGRALELAMRHLDADSARVATLRDRLEEGICSRVSIARVNGDRVGRIPNTTNIGFEALQAEAILMLLSNHGVCASSGSACSSGSLEPSHVLTAMGIDRRVVHGAIRFSLSRFTTEAEIDQVLDLMPGIIERLQKLQR
ncbi:MAG TPA: cysteine desulfurase NifS [Phycisphaerae bacterium]|mgnify:CR=1 FL=1|nr:cysteine desulfurase NifS [Phycisphaerae bacterium]HRR87278.1 cysteine desulfurase NifS [Phycisphaerae bacterium]